MKNKSRVLLLTTISSVAIFLFCNSLSFYAAQKQLESQDLTLLSSRLSNHFKITPREFYTTEEMAIVERIELSDEQYGEVKLCLKVLKNEDEAARTFDYRKRDTPAGSKPSPFKIGEEDAMFYGSQRRLLARRNNVVFDIKLTSDIEGIGSLAYQIDEIVYNVTSAASDQTKEKARQKVFDDILAELSKKMSTTFQPEKSFESLDYEGWKCFIISDDTLGDSKLFVRILPTIEEASQVFQAKHKANQSDGEPFKSGVGKTALQYGGEKVLVQQDKIVFELIPVDTLSQRDFESLVRVVNQCITGN